MILYYIILYYICIIYIISNIYIYILIYFPRPNVCQATTASLHPQSNHFQQPGVECIRLSCACNFSPAKSGHWDIEPYTFHLGAALHHPSLPSNGCSHSSVRHWKIPNHQHRRGKSPLDPNPLSGQSTFAACGKWC